MCHVVASRSKVKTDLMGYSQFHCNACVYSDLHGLMLLAGSTTYWREPGRLQWWRNVHLSAGWRAGQRRGRARDNWRWWRESSEPGLTGSILKEEKEEEKENWRRFVSHYFHQIKRHWKICKQFSPLDGQDDYRWAESASRFFPCFVPFKGEGGATWLFLSLAYVRI